MLVIKNCKILTADGSFTLKDLGIVDGLISVIDDAVSGEVLIDAKGDYVLPGIIDLHTHGIEFESAADSRLEDYARLEASKGATTFYPTLFSPPEVTAETLKRHRKETDELRNASQIQGFRLESPYLHHAGGGLSRDTVPISDGVTDMLLEAGGGHIKIWDVSPDLDGASEVIAKLSSKGIVCSLAHTYATINQAKAAIDAGAKLVTHMYNTFELPVETEGGCYPAGLVDYLLIEDRVYCEIIGDGTHVPQLNVEKAFRCKGYDQVVFVTDSNFGAGLPSGDYDLPGGWGRARINGSNNGVRLIDRDMGLSGSALSPIDSFRNVINLFGKDIQTASRLCSMNPARLMGLNKGEISVGKDADIIILDSSLNLLFTISAGNVIYKA